MTTVNRGEDYVSAPKDYAELFRIYYPYVVSLVRRCGIADSAKEDVASDILLRFYERDFLNAFNPHLVFHFNGRPHPARFKSFLSHFVFLYARGHQDRLRRLSTREPLVCDRLVGSGNGWVTWAEVYGPLLDGPETGTFDSQAEADLVARLRSYLLTVAPEPDEIDLVALFDAVVVQIRACGHWSVPALRRLFGDASASAVYGRLWRLRTLLAEAEHRPVPARRARTTYPRVLAAA